MNAGRGPRHDLKAYLIGFGFAVVLTAVPFALVAAQFLPRWVMLATIGAAAISQILVHLYYFLNLNLKTTPRENLYAIAFAAILIFILVGGSVWIMSNLHYRMIP